MWNEILILRFLDFCSIGIKGQEVLPEDASLFSVDAKNVWSYASTFPCVHGVVYN
jgi:hypothetical protein